MATRADADMRAGADPDRLAELEDERRFLLRSLRDLEVEHDAGDVDDADYTTLRDGYTKRAAAVLQEIDEGRAASPAPPPRGWVRRAVVVGVVLAVAAGAGWMVARSSGQRLAGQEITGGAPSADVPALLAQARALLAVDPLQAQQLYRQVLEQRPDHAEALAYSGWLLFTASAGASDDVRAAAVDTARQQLDRAVAADGEYADPHCFLAVIAGDQGDGATARTEVDTCLELGPPADVRGFVEEFAASLD
jgi:hypothetical protein